MKIKGKVLSLLLAMSVSVAALVPANAVVAQGAAEQESTATLDCVNYTNVAPLSSVVPTVRKMNKLTDAKIGTDNPGIETSKTVTKNEDGTYTLRLESYVTGSTMTSVTQKPTDTVLVLDTSGSMKEYINISRVELAKKLLIETDLSTLEISSKLGLENSNYFYTFFKKHTGSTPNQYRIDNKT